MKRLLFLALSFLLPLGVRAQVFPVQAAASGAIQNLPNGNAPYTSTSVTGPGSATSGNIASFNGTSGKALQDSGVNISADPNGDGKAIEYTGLLDIARSDGSYEQELTDTAGTAQTWGVAVSGADGGYLIDDLTAGGNKFHLFKATGALELGGSAYSTAGIMTNTSAGLFTSLSNATSASGTLLGYLGSGSPSSSTFLRGDGIWASPTGGGDVTGPGSSTTNGIATYSGTSGTVLSSPSWTLASETMTTPNGATLVDNGSGGLAIGSGGTNQSLALSPSGSGRISAGGEIRSTGNLILSSAGGSNSAAITFGGTNILFLTAGTGFANVTPISNSATSGAQAAFSISPTWNQSSGTAANTDLLVNRTQTAVGSGAQRLESLQVGSSEKWGVDNIGLMHLAAGIDQTFNPNSSAAGLNVGSYAGNPGTLANGDLWYNSSASALEARINGSTVALGSGGGGSPAGSNTQVQYNASGSFGANSGFTSDTSGDVGVKTLTTSAPGSSIVGATNGSSASSGNIGETGTASLAFSSGVSLTTAAAANVISQSLTAGIWLVWGNVAFNPNSGSVLPSQSIAWISTTSATLPTIDNGNVVYDTAAYTGLENLVINAAVYKFSSTTTVYMSAEATFATGSLNASGILYYLRIE